MDTKKKILIASDLDGTLIPPGRDVLDDLDIKNFNLAVRKNKNSLLTYITGRHLELALEGVNTFKLAAPDIFVCDVGTTIYFKKNGKWVLDEDYRARMRKAWRGYAGKDIENLLVGIKGLKKQEKSKQKEFKQSYYLPPEQKTRLIRQAKNRLQKHSLASSVIYSVDEKKSVGLLDILPASASKDSALKYLQKKLSVPKQNVVYAGDSGNDMEALLSGYRAIVVKNTIPEVREEAAKKARQKNIYSRLYFTNKKHAAGVLEGLRHFGFVSDPRKGLYIQMHSMHGLFRGKNLELGRDEDTGGQIVYVLELAKALARRPEVERVDIITRRILDKNYPGYSRAIEKVAPKVNIIRIECGPRRYIKKVDLWPYLDEFVRNTKKCLARLGRYPDILHSNYADSGLVCTKLSEDLGVPQVHTGHSLGRPKMKRLGVNGKNRAKMDKIYHFSRRIPAEEKTFSHASAIIASSEHEKKTQYGMYKVPDEKINIIPPGIDLKKFPPYAKKKNASLKKKFQKVFEKNFDNPSLPLVFTLSRLDHRKNLIALIKTFAQSEKLCKKANLMILIGPVKNASEAQKKLYKEMKLAVKKSELEKKVLIYDRAVNYKKEVPALYRITARTGGVLVNPALIEPFGLTLLEAAASGLPIVATENGGPVNIIKNCQNGFLFNPRRPKEIAKTVLKIIGDKNRWEKFSRNGIKNVKKFYSWDAAAKKEINMFKKILRRIISQHD